MSRSQTDQANQGDDPIYAAVTITGEWVQSVITTAGKWVHDYVLKPMQSYVNGEQATKSGIDTSGIPEEECQKIDQLEKERIAEFLREKHRSNARTRRR
ncbi:hypothetical protein BJX61DRAFT_544746 [Aspergillus egyptiacus]|nr:hypothetical protein BJX61DRAFT_544746 [Aspergillus egyptiacus]